MPKIDTNQTNIKPAFHILVFGFLWLIAGALFLFFVYLVFVTIYGVFAYNIIAKDPEYLLILISTPAQYYLLKESLPIFKNHGQVRTNGAAFAKSILFVVGSILIALATVITFLFISCG